MFILHRWGWAVFLLIVFALFVTIQIPLSNIKIFKVHTYECPTNGTLMSLQLVGTVYPRKRLLARVSDGVFPVVTRASKARSSEVSPCSTLLDAYSMECRLG